MLLKYCITYKFTVSMPQSSSALGKPNARWIIKAWGQATKGGSKTCYMETLNFLEELGSSLKSGGFYLDEPAAKLKRLNRLDDEN